MTTSPSGETPGHRDVDLVALQLLVAVAETQHVIGSRGDFTHESQQFGSVFRLPVAVLVGFCLVRFVENYDTKAHTEQGSVFSSESRIIRPVETMPIRSGQ